MEMEIEVKLEDEVRWRRKIGRGCRGRESRR